MKQPGILLLSLVIFLFFAGGVHAEKPDVSLIDRMPVLYKGRIQPLKALAFDVAETVYGRHKVRGISATEFLLGLIGDPKRWYAEPVVKIDYLPLKKETGLAADRRYFSMKEIYENQTMAGKMKAVAEKSERGEDLLPSDRRIQAIENALLTMDAVMNGNLIKMVPSSDRETQDWFSLRFLAEHGADTAGSVFAKFGEMITAFSEGDALRFERSARELLELLAAVHPEAQPPKWKLDWELAYYAAQPFRISWILYLAGGIFLLAAWSRDMKILKAAGIISFGLAFAFHTGGIIMRVAVLSRPPVSNMYESIIFMTWCISLFSIIFASIWRRLVFLNASAFVGAAVLLMGSLMPFDPGLDVLVPVLRSNYWLTIHVMTIVSSYGAFAVAMGVAHATLAHFIFWPDRADRIKDLTHLTYRALQVGVILIAAGTILGGVWANESWGRFWGWDPKETWALISLLGYLAVLHARHIGWLKDFGLAVSSVVCFFLIVMTWYGVNFVLGKGLHSYGFGVGGGQWITAYVLLECAFVAWAFLRRSKAGAIR